MPQVAIWLSQKCFGCDTLKCGFHWRCFSNLQRFLTHGHFSRERERERERERGKEKERQREREREREKETAIVRYIERQSDNIRDIG